MKLWKRRVPYDEMPWADLDGDGHANKGAARAMLYTERVNGVFTGCVVYADPDGIVEPDALDFGHEAAHILRNERNAMHHPWWHFCGLVGHTLRLGWHLTRREASAGRLLYAAADHQVIDV